MPMKTASPDAAQPALLYAARVETCERVASLFDDYCVDEADDQCVTWFDADRDIAIIEYFCASRAEAEQRLAALEAFLTAHAPGDRWEGGIRDVPAENWAETWKKFFHAEKVSDRIWVKPSWEPCPAAPGEVTVEIDPGMSFGTGQHGTTRGCLQVIDALSREAPALTLADIGCGSGILAIAAARLGYREILAIDNDPSAVSIARENAARNGVGDRITFREGALGENPLPGRFDVVVANILAGVLIARAGALAGALSASPAARLVLSGILNTQADEVLAAFAPLGYRPARRLQLGDWTTLVLGRQ